MFGLAQLPADMLREQMGNGLILMILGMAIVFVFLTILVFTTKAVSKIVRKFESKKPLAPQVQPVAAVAPLSQSEAEVAVAIAAAVAKSKN